jgi:D-alanyl-D-alanine carboxypeptidase
MKRSIAALAAALVLAAPAPAFASPFLFPRMVQDGYGSPAPPPVGAVSWILFDNSSGMVLAEQNADEVRAPASITKIMTVLLALELGDLADPVTVTERAANTGEREIDLVAGETVTLGALTKAAIIHSANDAATAIAQHIGGSVDGFAEMMNSRAAELGMTNTHFVNPHGLDADGHVTTARDMMLLAEAAMARQDFRDIARSRMVLVPDAPDGSTRIGTSTNLLLEDYEGSNGIKTGFTSQALLTYVASAQRDGRELYAVVLGTEGRRTHFDDARALFDYGFDDLRLYGALAGQAYVSRRLTIDPGPLTVASGLEATVHVAGEGLLTETPEAPTEIPDLPPPRVESTRRHAEDVPDDVWGALVFWIRAALGR